jgi:3-deoxy-D-manno-octulosonic-acid transferase
LLPFYNLFIRLYFIGIRLAATWNKKAAAWINGRKSLFGDLEKAIRGEDRIIWMHCSSAGEFEQGKPLIEAIKQEYPAHKILLSFFSPSGFKMAHNYKYADYITYLPLDTRKNAGDFVTLIKPELVIFVKYEFWYHHLNTVACHHIPLLLVSAVFRKDQMFFKRYGSFFRKMLFLFRHVFVQDKLSLQLLIENGVEQSSISGDTRFDRVKTIANDFEPIPFVEKSLLGNNCIVAGSTWKEDEEILKKVWERVQYSDLKLIIAPHEIHKAHLDELVKIFPEAVYYSSFEQNAGELKPAAVIIIDNVGLLSRLYQYATVTYVGGGFTKDGIHNILEAAVWGKPVVFGPNYKKYREASELIQAGAGFSISTGEELKKLADSLFTDKNHLQAAGNKAKSYIDTNTGATQKILRYIQEKRLLTKL